MSIGQKILIVEDDTSLREAISTVLANSGYIVTQAGNGDIGQFLSLLSEYDLLISDIGMPEVDGFTMVSFIKARVSIPVILITGHCEAEVAEKAKDAKINTVLYKPFEVAELLDAIEEILSK